MLRLFPKLFSRPAKGRKHTPDRRPLRRPTLAVERLEDRTVPASFALRVSTDGGATFGAAVSDNGAGDSNPAANAIDVNVGALTLLASSNDFVSTGLTTLGLQLSGVADAAPFDLVVQATVTDVTTAPAPQSLSYNFSGSLLPGGGTVTMQTWVDNSNTAFGTTGGGIAADTGSQAIPASGGPLALTGVVPYALTTQIHAVFTGPQSVSLNDSNAITPSPAGTPDLAVIKTADSRSIVAGNQIGFTVTIKNTGNADATGVQLNDLLPPGGGSDIFWTIDSGTGNPGVFQIVGSKGSQVLESNPVGGFTLGAGQSVSVHITSPTNAKDVSGGAVGVQSGVSSSVYLGAAGDYAVLYEGTGGHNLQITNVTAGGNVGVGGTGKVQFNGPGVITGRLDFSAANTGQFSNNNGQNVGPASVNYSVAAVTTALNTVNSLSSSLGGLTGTNIVISGNQTINEIAGATRSFGGVEYKVFNVTSYSENDGKLVTINGDGSGDPVVFNFGFNSNVNLGGDVALTGNGLSDDKVLWNFTTSGKNISLNNNASSFPSLAYHGIILAPHDAISVVNANVSGRVFGGNSSDMQIVSGDTIHAPLLNTATVTASNVTFDPDDTSSAMVTVTGPFKPMALLAAGTVYTGDALSLGSVNAGTYYVSVDGLAGGDVGAAELARVEDALANLNGELGVLGVTLVETDASTQDLANVHIHFADTSVIGGAADGVLGVTWGSDITLLNGWNWYLGSDPSGIAADQYDLQTIATHELGHAIGLGHSTDTSSVMYPYLATGDVRRDLTANDLSVIDSDGGTGAEPLLASDFTAPGVRDAANPPATVTAAASPIDPGQGTPLPSTPSPVAPAAPLTPGSIVREPARLENPVSSFVLASLAPLSSPVAAPARSVPAAGRSAASPDHLADAGLGNTALLPLSPVAQTYLVGASDSGLPGDGTMDTATVLLVSVPEVTPGVVPAAPADLPVESLPLTVPRPAACDAWFADHRAADPGTPIVSDATLSAGPTVGGAALAALVVGFWSNPAVRDDTRRRRFSV